jgi:hypothetical protein
MLSAWRLQYPLIIKAITPIARAKSTKQRIIKAITPIARAKSTKPRIIKAIAPIARAEPNKPALRADHWAHTAHYAYAARASPRGPLLAHPTYIDPPALTGRQLCVQTFPGPVLDAGGPILYGVVRALTARTIQSGPVRFARSLGCKGT